MPLLYANEQTFWEVLLTSEFAQWWNNIQDIENGIYQVMVINPESLIGNTTLKGLWKKPKFMLQLLCFIFDEGLSHCISQWGAFQNKYLLLGNLWYLIPETIPFYITSATATQCLAWCYKNLAPLATRNWTHNDRPNIHLVVWEIKYTVSSYANLTFLIPNNFKQSKHQKNPSLT